MKPLMLILSLIVAALVISAGCTSTRNTSKPASPNQAPTVSGTADLSSLTHIEVSSIKKHWTSGAEYDGITIHPDLRDAADQTIKWSGATLPVDIEIWTTQLDNNFKQVKDQLVYKGSGTITNWQDGNMFLNGGIRVPFSSMKVPAGKTFGWTYVTVHTPDGKTYSAIDQFTGLTP